MRRVRLSRQTWLLVAATAVACSTPRNQPPAPATDAAVADVPVPGDRAEATPPPIDTAAPGDHGDTPVPPPARPDLGAETRSDAPACNNGWIEPGETCDPLASCPTSCPRLDCTRRQLVNAGTCQATCQAGDLETACVNGDACCPSGCTHLDDSDCAQPNRMFVTSTRYAADLGGLAGADAKCADRARAASLPGQFVAYLATAAQPASQRLGDSSGWVRVDGKPFANTVADLVGGRVLFPPRIDELGRPVDLAAGVFVGATRDGTTDPGRTCRDWTDAVAMDGLAYADADSGGRDWQAAQWGSCALTLRLYCFEVGRKASVGVRKPAPGTARIAFASAPTEPTFGAAGADALCAEEAMAAGLPGTYKAFLSTPTQSAAARFDLAGPPWVRPDGVPIVEKASDLLGKRLLAPISVGVIGAVVGAGGAWTGSRAPNETAQSHCRGWTSSADTDSASFGVPSTAGPRWFHHDVFAAECSQQLVVYCFQQ